jgi:tRNA (adenine37-N6)-methyltransferase
VTSGPRQDSGAIRFEPIGVFRSPFTEPAQAPRQPAAARGVQGRIELAAGRGFEFALSDLERWRYLWVLFFFDRVEGWRAKVRPPRSRVRRGVFATRSPHRPNPIGLSAMQLLKVEGLTLTVANVDILDGTPVLDIKPYVAYTDAIVDAGAGWLTPDAAIDPGPRWEVELAPLALEQSRFLAERSIEVAEPVRQALALGPAPHPYRRIKRDGDAFVLAHKDWRARFQVDGARVTVLSFGTGYRPRELASSTDPALEPHRAFVAIFGHRGHAASERDAQPPRAR